MTIKSPPPLHRSSNVPARPLASLRNAAIEDEWRTLDSIVEEAPEPPARRPPPPPPAPPRRASRPDEPLLIASRTPSERGRDALVERFAAGGTREESGLDDLPLPSLRSNTTLYAMWSALGVAAAMGLGSAIWMAFVQKPF